LFSDSENIIEQGKVGLDKNSGLLLGHSQRFGGGREC